MADPALELDDGQVGAEQGSLVARLPRISSSDFELLVRLYVVLKQVAEFFHSTI